VHVDILDDELESVSFMEFDLDFDHDFDAITEDILELSAMLFL
jgi:hypothetical protein